MPGVYPAGRKQTENLGLLRDFPNNAGKLYFAGLSFVPDGVAEEGLVALSGAWPGRRSEFWIRRLLQFR